MSYNSLTRPAQRTIMDRLFRDDVVIRAHSIKKLNGEKDYVFTRTSLQSPKENKIDIESEALYALYQANVRPNDNLTSNAVIKEVKKYLAPILRFGVYPRCGLRSKSGDSFLSDSVRCMKTRSGKDLNCVERSQWFQRLLVSFIKLWAVYSYACLSGEPTSRLSPILVERTNELCESIIHHKNEIIKHELLKSIYKLLESKRFNGHVESGLAEHANIIRDAHKIIDKKLAAQAILSFRYLSHVHNNIVLLQNNQVNLDSDVVSHIVKLIDWRI